MAIEAHLAVEVILYGVDTFFELVEMDMQVELLADLLADFSVGGNGSISVKPASKKTVRIDCGCSKGIVTSHPLNPLASR